MPSYPLEKCSNHKLFPVRVDLKYGISREMYNPGMSSVNFQLMVRNAYEWRPSQYSSNHICEHPAVTLPSLVSYYADCAWT